MNLKHDQLSNNSMDYQSNRSETSHDNDNRVVEEGKVYVTSINLEGMSLDQVRSYEITNANVSQGKFSKDAIQHFGPSIYENVVGKLTKLHQTSSMKQCQLEFRALMNRTKRLNEEFFIGCFISRLQLEICNRVSMFTLVTLVQVIGLAFLQRKL